MSINNFDQISKLLTFNSKDEFYFVQIIQRKKDNKGIQGSNNKNRLMKAYYITSVEKLLKLKDEMIFFANHFNARVGINLNKRSFEKTAFNTLQKIAHQMHNRDFKSVRASYNSACGIHNAVDDKLWILDVDEVGRQSNDIILFAERECQPEGNKFVTIIPSKSGYHIIMKPFDLSKFGKKFPDIEIHKNNPTNLYIP